MSSLVSIIIPCYNQGRFLSEAIRSAVDQDYPHKEIIVVNDGSTDNTRDAASEFHHAVTYVEQENRGVSAARNMAIEIASGNYICFLDGDDILLPHSVSKRVQYLDTHPDTGMVCGDAITFNDGGSIGLKSVTSGKPHHPTNFRWETVDYTATMSTAMVRRSCLEKVGLFEESLRVSEDWLLFVKLSLHFNMAYLGEPLVMYRLHSNNITKTVVLNNASHRTAIAQIMNAPYFCDYPAHFRSQLLFLRFASTWRFTTKPEALRYFLRAIKTDPAQIVFGLKVVCRGTKNIFRRYFLKDGIHQRTP